MLPKNWREIVFVEARTLTALTGLRVRGHWNHLFIYTLPYFYIFLNTSHASKERWRLSFQVRGLLLRCLICLWFFFSLCTLAPYSLVELKSEKKLNVCIYNRNQQQRTRIFLLLGARIRGCRHSHSSGSVVFGRDRISLKITRQDSFFLGPRPHNGKARTALHTVLGWRMCTILPWVKITT